MRPRYFGREQQRSVIPYMCCVEPGSGLPKDWILSKIDFDGYDGFIVSNIKACVSSRTPPFGLSEPSAISRAPHIPPSPSSAPVKLSRHIQGAAAGARAAAY